MSLPLPKAPDAGDHECRTLEFSYDGSVQGYVVDEVCPGFGTIDFKIKDQQVRDYRIRVMECQDGYIDNFQAEIDLLKAWGLRQEKTIPDLVGVTPLCTTAVYLLHKTPMVMEIVNRMNVEGMRRSAKEFEGFLKSSDPFHDKTIQGKRARFAAMVRKPNGDLIWWPIANNQIGVIVD